MPSTPDPQDVLAAERLKNVLGYIDALVRVDETPAQRLAQHKLPDGSQFILHVHEFLGLPGILTDFIEAEGACWLKIERLQRVRPPAPEPTCLIWIDLSNDPEKPPTVRPQRVLRLHEAELPALKNSETVRDEDVAPSLKEAGQGERAGAYLDIVLRLEDRPSINEAIDAYVNGPWLAWAETEKPRRRAIAVYLRAFEIAQRMAQAGGRESIEIVCGIGLARWRRDGEDIELPLLDRAVEIEIDEAGDAAIRLRPRSLPARADLRPFEKLAGPRLRAAEEGVKSSLRTLENRDPEGLSPFRPEGFMPALRVACAQLDPGGRYLDQESLFEPPTATQGDTLTVDERFVFFARRRSTNALLQDVEKFKAKLEKDGPTPILEGAARTLVLGPGDGIDSIFVPLGARIGSGHEGGVEEPMPGDPDDGDLFFPKPFNDDQVSIVRRLEEGDGLVVQGPPGTGKTHTIANIICHMLASGRRVLVVSHGETALKVIQDQLPEGVRDLTISVTTSDRDGFKQIEKAAGLMLGIVNDIGRDPRRARASIAAIEASVVRLRDRLAILDNETSTLATRALAPLPGNSETPYQVAQRLLSDAPRFDWFADRPLATIGPSDLPDDVVAAARAARTRAGTDLAYAAHTLPNPLDLPPATKILEWRRDLVAAAAHQAAAAANEPALRRIVARLGVDGAQRLINDLGNLDDALAAVAASPWAEALHVRSRTSGFDVLRPAIVAFLADARAIADRRAVHVARPVQHPDDRPPRETLAEVLGLYAAGKNPFGLLGFRLRGHQPFFTQIRVAGLPPAVAADWMHVAAHFSLLDDITTFGARWTALRAELELPDELRFETLAKFESIAERLAAAAVEAPRRRTDLETTLQPFLGEFPDLADVLDGREGVAALADEIAHYVAAIRLGAVKHAIEETIARFGESELPLLANARSLLSEALANPDTNEALLERVWNGLLAKLAHLRGLDAGFAQLREAADLIAKLGAPRWAARLLDEPATHDADPAIPPDWRDAWNWAASRAQLEAADVDAELAGLHRTRLDVESQLRHGLAQIVKERTFYNLATKMPGKAMAALRAFSDLVRRIGAGTGQRAAIFRADSRRAMEDCYDAVPCWIMPAWRVSEQLPADFAAFDLVILDEASQSDVRELPALLRGKKILVVGDDRQVSPTAAFLPIASIERLRANFLDAFPFPAQIEPGASLYDLARVMFPNRFVMLREHFRCAEPIIRFSMQFYNEPLVPLRVPKSVERLDPPLVDILVLDGKRPGRSKVNPAEAEVVIREIEAILDDPALAYVGGDRTRPRTLGVISLVGAEQALLIQKKLLERVGEEAILHHRIVCGDSATFQGDERDIVLISMVADPERRQAQTALQYQQRYNVALSRARDRVILVRSVTEEDLNPRDLKARLIQHFRSPMPARAENAARLVDLCQSDFERDVFSALTELGYRVTPQVGSLGFSIDLVVEGAGGRRLAVECDGDLYHGPDRWADDMRRQRILERVGWTFWRCFGSSWTLDPEGRLDDLIATASRLGIEPVGAEDGPAAQTLHRTEYGAKSIPPSVPEEIRNAASAPSLREGDQIVVRYLDEPDASSRPLAFTLTATHDDRINGYLSLTSPLARTLVDAVAGDEMTVDEGQGPRPLLFVLHQRSESLAEVA